MQFAVEWIELYSPDSSICAFPFHIHLVVDLPTQVTQFVEGDAFSNQYDNHQC